MKLFGLQHHIATRQDRAVTIAIAVLLLLVGFLGGYWVSEMEKEAVIIFEEIKHDGKVLSESDIHLLREQAQKHETSSESVQQIVDPVAQIESSRPAPILQQQAGAGFVASVNGTKYYYPDCGDVSRIKEENKVWFATEQEAIRAGYEMSVCVQRRRE